MNLATLLWRSGYSCFASIRHSETICDIVSSRKPTIWINAFFQYFIFIIICCKRLILGGNYEALSCFFQPSAANPCYGFFLVYLFTFKGLCILTVHRLICVFVLNFLHECFFTMCFVLRLP